MNNEPLKAAARARVAELVRNFRRNESDYLRPTYNETQARTDFVTPLLEAFGWDVHNNQGQPLSLREVIEEATVEVGEERLSKKPDYELRLARQRKLFVEAKKPNVRIDRDRAPAFQTRRYGYSASLPVAILTNFYHLAIYDCIPAPAKTDVTQVARIDIIRYDEFESRFNYLWDTFSREAIYSGDFDRRFGIHVIRHGVQQFDDYFLSQVRAWRERLAINIHANTSDLNSAELAYAVQLFLSRIVFLRICEDRDIEKYETLKNLNDGNTFAALMGVLQRADAFYDSGLFRLLDDARLGIRISDTALQSVISDLYYPESPYTFAVVETEVLGQIYEQFLGEVITVSNGVVEIISKPEVRASGGVVPTPRHIVDVIVWRTLVQALAGKGPADLVGFTVADICCGSGIFLLSVYELLLDHYLSWYLSNNRPDHIGRTIYEDVAGRWRLTFEEKRRILLAHLRGVDIDANAVEVAQFSLLLKLIEDETVEGLQDYVSRHRMPALPSLYETVRCGNSLVSQAEWTAAKGAMPALIVDKVNPITWVTEFSADMERGGFDAIVFNPPYIRIQNMTIYSPEEVAFYQSPDSPYMTAREENFDKYGLFVERALTLLKPTGRLGAIVPHKFMTIKSGCALRRLIAVKQLLDNVVHFGVNQVFGPSTANYTCILVLDQLGRDHFLFEQVTNLAEWRYGQPGIITTIPATELTDAPWEFANAETRALFERVRSTFSERLGQLAEIFVGVQTSNDDVYIFGASGETRDTVTLQWNGQDWPIERGILRPCLHDVTLYAYTTPHPNAWMIFPYQLVEGQRRTEARLFQPVDMASRFPGCWAYLNARREELEGRNITGGNVADRQWYQFGRSQSLTKFDSSKIILPILSIEPRYIYDDANIVVTGGGNGPYYMIRPRRDARVTNHFLLAVLNHPLSEAFVRTRTSLFRGGYYSHGKQFIENLPIPVPNDNERTVIEALVESLISTIASVESARLPQQRIVRERQVFELKAQIENRVSALFGLSTFDMEVIQSVPVPA